MPVFSFTWTVLSIYLCLVLQGLFYLFFFVLGSHLPNRNCSEILLHYTCVYCYRAVLSIPVFSFTGTVLSIISVLSFTGIIPSTYLFSFTRQFYLYMYVFSFTGAVHLYLCLISQGQFCLYQCVVSQGWFYQYPCLVSQGQFHLHPCLVSQGHFLATGGAAMWSLLDHVLHLHQRLPQHLAHGLPAPETQAGKMCRIRVSLCACL